MNHGGSWDARGESAHVRRQRKEQREAGLRSRVRALCEQGVEARFIAERLGLSTTTVRRLMRDAGVKPSGRKGGVL